MSTGTDQTKTGAVSPGLPGNIDINTLSYINNSNHVITEIDSFAATFSKQSGINFLRVCMAVPLIWFGGLKVWNKSYLGIIEILIGLGMLAWKHPFIKKVTLFLLIILLPITVVPVFQTPDVIWKSKPFNLTPDGQLTLIMTVYIVAILVVFGAMDSQSEQIKKDSNKLANDINVLRVQMQYDPYTEQEKQITANVNATKPI